MLAAEVVRVDDRLDAVLQAERFHLAPLHLGYAVGEQADAIARPQQFKQAIGVLEQPQLWFVRAVGSDQFGN